MSKARNEPHSLYGFGWPPMEMCVSAKGRLFVRPKRKTKSMSNSPDDPLLHETHAKTDLRAFWREQAKWSQATFGSDKERGPTGPLKHLAKEAVEAQANPTDLMEFVDCLFLTFDATRRAGFTFQQLCDAAWDKLEINKARKWQKPTTDDAVEHVRD